LHELFDPLDYSLLCGKFRLPFYSKETPVAALVPKLNPVEFFSSLCLNIRICMPNDPNLDIDCAEFQ